MSIERLKLKHVSNFHRWTREATGFYDIGIFANVVKIPGELEFIGACRYGNASLDDNIHIVKYNNDFNLLSNEFVTSGEDPRCFLFNNAPYALTWKPYFLNNVIVLDYKLINLRTKQITILKIEEIPPSPLSVLGKNWMPLVKDNELYIVISLEPQLLIVKADVLSGKCNWVVGDFRGAIDVTLSRGGTPLIYCNELKKYIGLGHRSYSSHHHMPFFYTLSNDFTNVEIGDDIDTGKMFVQDPQSIFKLDDKYFCCIGNWNVPADGSVDMYEIAID